MFVFGVGAIEGFDTGLPIWAFILCLVIAAVYVIPIGIIQAITNQQIGLKYVPLSILTNSILELTFLPASSPSSSSATCSPAVPSQ